MGNKLHILIVDDDKEIREPLAHYLTQNGLRVTAVENSIKARKAMSESFFNLMLLDVMMPDENGFQFCTDIRRNSSIPIIFLTARTQDIDRVMGFELGCDDYVLKPFNPRVLQARIESVVRRSVQPSYSAPITSGNKFKFKNWQYDSLQQQLINQKGIIYSLSTMESRLLMTFLMAPGCELSRCNILQSVHGDQAEYVYDRSIDTLISRLRRKLDLNASDKKIIQTVWGQGYIFTSNVEIL